MKNKAAKKNKIRTTELGQQSWVFFRTREGGGFFRLFLLPLSLISARLIAGGFFLSLFRFKKRGEFSEKTKKNQSCFFWFAGNKKERERKEEREKNAQDLLFAFFAFVGLGLGFAADAAFFVGALAFFARGGEGGGAGAFFAFFTS